ncbi:hypothetical protein BGW38_007771, partial [Lunasporangiospora selenospora]
MRISSLSMALAVATILSTAGSCNGLEAPSPQSPAPSSPDLSAMDQKPPTRIQRESKVNPQSPSLGTDPGPAPGALAPASAMNVPALARRRRSLHHAATAGSYLARRRNSNNNNSAHQSSSLNMAKTSMETRRVNEDQSGPDYVMMARRSTLALNDDSTPSSSTLLQQQKRQARPEAIVYPMVAKLRKRRVTATPNTPRSLSEIGKGGQDTMMALPALPAEGFIRDTTRRRRRQLVERAGPGLLDSLVGNLAKPPPTP